MKALHPAAAIVCIGGKKRKITAVEFFEAMSRERISLTVDVNGRVVLGCSGSSREKDAMKGFRKILNESPELEALVLMGIADFNSSPSARKAALAIRSLLEEREAIKSADGIETTLMNCAMEHVQNTPPGKDVVTDHEK